MNHSILETQALIRVPEGRYLLHSHKAYLYSIFYNLISNAIKYRSAKPLIVTISVEDSPEKFIVQLTDNGIGIDLRRHHDDLFRPYKRFNNDKKGKGLGLFLVKSHMDALQGTISIHSEPDKGTSFEMTFFKEKYS